MSSTSTITLSIPKPANADIKCSIVAIWVSPSTKVVAKVVAPTLSTIALISTCGFKSILLKIIPVSSSAGNKFNFICLPECNPTPVALIGLVSVLWTNIFLLF